MIDGYFRRGLNHGNGLSERPIMKINMGLGFRVDRTAIRGEKLLVQSR